jgi:hypothetical protein
MSGRFRVLVTGSRDWTDRDLIRAKLLEVYRKHPTALLIHGDARGADRLAADIWTRMGGQAKPYPANWRPSGRYNPQAGNVRNDLMVSTMPDLVLAFFQMDASNRGTSDCVKRALAAGLDVTAMGDVPLWVQEALRRAERGGDAIPYHGS